LRTSGSGRTHFNPPRRLSHPDVLLPRAWGKADLAAEAAPRAAKAGGSESACSLFFRVLVCTVAVSLVWATSLRSARWMTSLVVTAPDLSFVWDECRGTYDMVQMERDAHQRCSGRAATLCDAALDARLGEEMARARAEADANVALQAEAEALQEVCVARRLEVLRGLQALAQHSIAQRSVA
jgi:hypothetical protein